MAEIYQCWLRNSSMRLKFKNFNKSNLLNLWLEIQGKGWHLALGCACFHFTCCGGRLFPGACFAVTPPAFQSKVPLPWLMWFSVCFLGNAEPMRSNDLGSHPLRCLLIGSSAEQNNSLWLAPREVAFKQQQCQQPQQPDITSTCALLQRGRRCGLRVVDQTDQDCPASNWRCFCRHVWTESDFKEASGKKLGGSRSWENDTCIWDCSRVMAPVAAAVLCFSVGGRCSVTQGRSQRPEDCLKQGSSVGRLLLIKAPSAWLAWLRGRLLRGLSSNFLGELSLPGFEKCFLGSTSSFTHFEGEIYSAFEGNWLKFGQTVPGLAARLDALVVLSGAHPSPADPFCIHFHVSGGTSVDRITQLPYPVASAWVWPIRGDQRKGGRDSGLCSLFLASPRGCHVLPWAASFRVCCWLGLPASTVPFWAWLFLHLYPPLVLRAQGSSSSSYCSRLGVFPAFFSPPKPIFFLIEAKSIQGTMNHSKAHSSLVLKAPRVLCKPHLFLVSKQFHGPRTPCTC